MVEWMHLEVFMDTLASGQLPPVGVLLLKTCSNLRLEHDPVASSSERTASFTCVAKIIDISSLIERERQRGKQAFL